MTKYLLSVHMTEAEPGTEHNAPRSEEEMAAMGAAIGALEAELRAENALLFSGRLQGPADAHVVRTTNGRILTTDGPFVESKEQIGGFYIIEADDLDAALDWASKTSAAINSPIEVRPFFDAVAG